MKLMKCLSRISYDNTITYSSLIDTPINFLNIDFSNTEVNLDNKNYFKFVIEVQNGFDNNGNKTYTTIEFGKNEYSNW